MEKWNSGMEKWNSGMASEKCIMHSGSEQTIISVSVYYDIYCTVLTIIKALEGQAMAGPIL